MINKGKISGECRFGEDGKIKFIIYDEQAMEDMAKTMIGKDIIKGGCIVGKVTHAEVIDGKILWEGEAYAKLSGL
jgi:hypothetical protein